MTAANNAIIPTEEKPVDTTLDADASDVQRDVKEDAFLILRNFFCEGGLLNYSKDSVQFYKENPAKLKKEVRCVHQVPLT